MAPLCGLQLVVGLVLMVLAPSSLATVYIVGGPAGWTTPSRAKVNYTDWAASTPFKVGDSLEFNYVYKAHTVLEVSRSDYRRCNRSSPVASFEDLSGSTTVKLTKPGNFYFIDGVGDHCELGQKFEATVAGEDLAGDVAAPSSPPSPSPAMPPATSSASPCCFSCVAAPLLMLALAAAGLSFS